MKTATSTPSVLRSPGKPQPIHFLFSLGMAVCLAGSIASADDLKEKQVEKAKSENDQSTAKVLITGSRLPQKVKVGRLPGTAQQVTIIDQKQIQRSGAVTLAELLRRNGNGR